MKKKREKVVVSWSGGKDSAYALYEIFRDGGYEVAALITNVVEEAETVKMHGVRKSLLLEQAEAVGVPLEIVWVSAESRNGEYEKKTGEVLEKFKKQGITTAVFGDLFLEDIKAYRDGCLERWGFKGLYPLWRRPTPGLALTMMETGFRTVLTCVDTRVLPQDLAGREYDRSFLKDLPESADPCGENGEFHTFVYDGPIFKRPVLFRRGDFRLQDGRFYYCDIQPAAGV